jgi:hypothetical protein
VASSGQYVPDGKGGWIVLTVTTWNVQNLFPAGSPDGPETQQAYDDKLDALAGTIRTLERPSAWQVASEHPAQINVRSYVTGY